MTPATKVWGVIAALVALECFIVALVNKKLSEEWHDNTKGT